jgi:transcriptional regulator with GAF, ATPase, and Fis domain
VADTEPTGTEQDPAVALADDFSKMSRILFAARSGQATLDEVIRLAAATIEGCDYAGIFLLDGDTVTTPVHTDPIVAEVDLLQHHIGEGPCLDALTQRTIFYADDLHDDARWPRFGPQAAARGMRSLLAVPLSANSMLGALNLYAHYPSAFGVLDRARAVLLAALAAVAFTSARSHEDDDRRSANLHAALTTREMIGQAQGILMERERVTADQAFGILRRASQHLNIKLREVAQGLVETGERPDTGDAGPP